MRHLVSRGLETSNFAPAIASTLGAPQGHPAAAQQVVRWDCVPPDDLCWAAAGWPGGAERWPSVCHSRLQSCTCTCTCTYVFSFGFVPGFVFSSRTFRDPSPCACLRDGTYRIVFLCSLHGNPRRVSPFCKHASVRNMVLRGVGCCSQPSHAHCQCHSCLLYLNMIKGFKVRRSTVVRLYGVPLDHLSSLVCFGGSDSSACSTHQSLSMINIKPVTEPNTPVLAHSPLLPLQCVPVPVPLPCTCVQGVYENQGVPKCYAVWRDDASLSSTAPSRNANSLTS